MFCILCRQKAVANETVHKETTEQKAFESISVHTLGTEKFCVSKFDNKKHIWSTQYEIFTSAWTEAGTRNPMKRVKAAAWNICITTFVWQSHGLKTFSSQISLCKQIKAPDVWKENWFPAKITHQYFDCLLLLIKFRSDNLHVLHDVSQQTA